MSPARRAAGDRERGAATAELAMVLPLLVAVTWGLGWLLSLGVAQVRIVDAARETARAAARGDPVSSAVARGREVAPDGTALVVSTGAQEVRVTASTRVAGPGSALFAWLPSVPLAASAVAVSEDPP